MVRSATPVHPDLLALNATPYVAESLPLGPRPERQDLTFIAKGTFDLVPGDVATCSAAQLPLAGSDVQDEPDPDALVVIADSLPLVCQRLRGAR